MELLTERLRLRRWVPADSAPFAVLNADPEVMEFLPGPLTPEASDAFLERIEECFTTRGFGLWALSPHDSDELLGYTGLWPARFEASFTPAVEVGWRLARHAWGHGYATEAGREALSYAFSTLGLPEVVSFTAVPNVRSQRVMERLGMTYDGTFAHPSLPEGHPLRQHVLHRARNPR